MQLPLHHPSGWVTHLWDCPRSPVRFEKWPVKHKRPTVKVTVKRTTFVLKSQSKWESAMLTSQLGRRVTTCWVMRLPWLVKTHLGTVIEETVHDVDCTVEWHHASWNKQGESLTYSTDQSKQLWQWQRLWSQLTWETRSGTRRVKSYWLCQGSPASSACLASTPWSGLRKRLPITPIQCSSKTKLLTKESISQLMMQLMNAGPDLVLRPQTYFSHGPSPWSTSAPTTLVL